MNDYTAVVSLSMSFAVLCFIIITLDKAYLEKQAQVSQNLVSILIAAVLVVTIQILIVLQYYNVLHTLFWNSLLQQFYLLVQLYLLTSMFLLFFNKAENYLGNKKITPIENAVILFLFPSLIYCSFFPTMKFGIKSVAIKVSVLIFAVLYFIIEMLECHQVMSKNYAKQIQFLWSKEHINHNFQLYHEYECLGKFVRTKQCQLEKIDRRFKLFYKTFYQRNKKTCHTIYIFDVLLLITAVASYYSQSMFAAKSLDVEKYVANVRNFMPDSIEWAYAESLANKQSDFITTLTGFIPITIMLFLVTLLETYHSIEINIRVEDVLKNESTISEFAWWLFSNRVEYLESFLIDSQNLKSREIMDIQDYDAFLLKQQFLVEEEQLPLTQQSLASLRRLFYDLQNQIQDNGELMSELISSDTSNNFNQVLNSQSQREFNELFKQALLSSETQATLFFSLLCRLFKDYDQSSILDVLIDTETRYARFLQLLFGKHQITYYTNSSSQNYGTLSSVYDFEETVAKNKNALEIQEYSQIIQLFIKRNSLSRIVNFEFDANILSYFEEQLQHFVKINNLLNRQYDQSVVNLKDYINKKIYDQVIATEDITEKVQYNGPRILIITQEQIDTAYFAKQKFEIQNSRFSNNIQENTQQLFSLSLLNFIYQNKIKMEVPSSQSVFAIQNDQLVSQLTSRGMKVQAAKNMRQQLPQLNVENYFFSWARGSYQMQIEKCSIKEQLQTMYSEILQIWEQYKIHYKEDAVSEIILPKQYPEVMHRIDLMTNGNSLLLLNCMLLEYILHTKRRDNKLHNFCHELQELVPVEQRLTAVDWVRRYVSLHYYLCKQNQVGNIQFQLLIVFFAVIVKASCHQNGRKGTLLSQFDYQTNVNVITLWNLFASYYPNEQQIYTKLCLEEACHCASNEQLFRQNCDYLMLIPLEKISGINYFQEFVIDLTMMAFFHEKAIRAAAEEVQYLVQVFRHLGINVLDFM